MINDIFSKPLSFEKTYVVRNFIQRIWHFSLNVTGMNCYICVLNYSFYAFFTLLLQLAGVIPVVVCSALKNRLLSRSLWRWVLNCRVLNGVHIDNLPLRCKGSVSFSLVKMQRTEIR